MTVTWPWVGNTEACHADGNYNMQNKVQIRPVCVIILIIAPWKYFHAFFTSFITVAFLLFTFRECGRDVACLPTYLGYTFHPAFALYTKDMIFTFCNFINVACHAGKLLQSSKWVIFNIMYHWHAMFCTISARALVTAQTAATSAAQKKTRRIRFYRYAIPNLPFRQQFPLGSNRGRCWLMTV